MDVGLRRAASENRFIEPTTAPLWRRRSQSGAVFNEGEMKGISGFTDSVRTAPRSG